MRAETRTCRDQRAAGVTRLCGALDRSSSCDTRGRGAVSWFVNGGLSNATPEFGDALTNPATNFGKLPGSEYDQDDNQNDEQMDWLKQAFEHFFPPVLDVRRFSPQAEAYPTASAETIRQIAYRFHVCTCVVRMRMLPNVPFCRAFCTDLSDHH